MKKIGERIEEDGVIYLIEFTSNEMESFEYLQRALDGESDRIQAMLDMKRKQGFSELAPVFEIIIDFANTAFMINEFLDVATRLKSLYFPADNQEDGPDEAP